MALLLLLLLMECGIIGPAAVAYESIMRRAISGTVAACY